MPDVMNFQKELKRGNVRPAWEDTKGKGKDAHREDDAAETKSAKSRGKKRSSAAHEGTPASEDELPEKKRQRTTPTSKKNKAVIGNGQQSRQDQEESGEESGEEEDSVVVDSKSRRRKSSTRDNAIASAASKSVEVQSSRHNPKAVRIMTTQVTVSDEVSRILTKLGVKMTSKPSECTHLVARNLVRTEKFLCAMAVAPFVVNEKWLLASAAAKQILPEEHYALRDPETEKKHGFKLPEALRRSKETGGKLFAGKTFYITPKVTVDTKLLKNVVIANGGQVISTTPTVRILKSNAERYVISAPADKSIWRPLAQHGYTIYLPELILDGVLRQEIRWDRQDNILTDTS